MKDIELIAKFKGHHPLYGAEFVFYPEPGGHMERVSVWSDSSPAAAQEELKKHLLESGYTKPKWWQYWRWKENRQAARNFGLLD